MEKISLLEGERIDDLQCGGARIIQHPGLFRFGTDAVLLQNFANLPSRARAVDLGTGTGILPILLCTRQAQIIFDAVEIQSACVDMARRSVQLNGLQERIAVHEMDLKDAPERLGREKYDAVLCNPPYGRRGGVLHNPNSALAIARHEILTDLETVVHTASRLLRPGGRFFMVHQADRLAEIAVFFSQEKLPLKRLRTVHPAPGARAQLVLCEGLKMGGDGCAVLPPLILKDDSGAPSGEVQKIYAGEKTV